MGAGVFVYLLIFVAAACLGGQVNRGIYRLAWYRRPIGPWSAPHPERRPGSGRTGCRSSAGSVCAARQACTGRGSGSAPWPSNWGWGWDCAVLYWWEVEHAGLMPEGTGPRHDPWLLYAQYLSHVTLIAFMVVATWIDVDEKTIPDAITVPGTLLGLVLLAVWPQAAPPVVEPAGLGGYRVGHLLLTSPHAWSTTLDGGRGLVIGLACFAGWCLAIWPRTVTLRRGWIKGVQYLAVSMFRFHGWWWYPALLAAGAGGITLGWWCGSPGWPSLLTALVGMAFGGGLIWTVRVVAGGALGKEALGFGDVTLMAMIGTYLGWQAVPMVFFFRSVRGHPDPSRGMAGDAAPRSGLRAVPVRGGGDHDHRLDRSGNRGSGRSCWSWAESCPSCWPAASCCWPACSACGGSSNGSYPAAAVSVGEPGARAEGSGGSIRRRALACGSPGITAG